MPVRPLEEVDEVDVQGLFGLAALPIRNPAVTFQVLAEPADLIRQWFVRRLAGQEPSDPSHTIRRSTWPNQLALQQKFRELLQRSFPLAHAAPPARWGAIGAPQRCCDGNACSNSTLRFAAIGREADVGQAAAASGNCRSHLYRQLAPAT